MPAVHWTQEQRDAIEARGGPILVSAAAGSGKTAVLTSRVLRLITEGESPIPADRLLIVTFSNAAAAEMKERIERQLEERVTLDPDNEFLRSQQLLLQGASIGTIHAFCLDLIRRNFQQLSLPADLRVADGRELELLRRETLEEIIARRYASGDEMFLSTVELFSASRGDERLLKTVLRLYDFTRSHPFPEDWLREKLALYDSDRPVGETPWGEEILSYARGALRFSLDILREALERMREDEKLAAAYRGAFESDADQIERSLRLADAGDWDGTLASLRATVFQKLRPLRGYEDEAAKKWFLEQRGQVKDLVERMRERHFCATAAETAEDLRDLRPRIETLFSLVGEFAESFSEAKRERKALDFSDLEQFALRLLCERTPEGEVHPTEYALSLRGEYGAILIDEYQDTNEAQEMIFSCLTDGENEFLVGDVKQSIYGFRQANPRIFLRKKDAFDYYDREGSIQGGAKIILGANFRSHPAVCEGVNALFGACMSRRVGEIEYDEDERLIPLGAFAENPQAGMELALIDVSEEEESAVRLEAREVARRIADMIARGETVSERGELRPVRAGDIGILLRSPKGRAEIYLSALADAGIPAVSGTQSTFLQTAEIGAATAILGAVSNPLSDVPLAAMLLSPVYALSAGDAARIRLYRRDAPLYLAMLEGAREGDADCIRVLEDLRVFRAAAARMGTDSLLRLIYERTSMMELMSALDNAALRRANLNLLVEYARVYERAGYRTLTQFLRFLESVEEDGGDLAPAAGAGEGINAVRIMSIHRSKGLEFPVVFLCDCARRFNRDDLRQSVLLHARFGFACMRRDVRTATQFTTVPLEAARLAAEREMLGEEMRILYVALTRAKERLILTAAVDNPGKKLASLRLPLRPDGRLPEHAVSRAQGALDWLLMAVLSTADGAPLCEYVSLPAGEGEGAGVRCTIAPPTDRAETSADENTLRREAEPSDSLRERLSSVMQRRYPFAAAASAPAKVAVTALVGELEAGERFLKEPQFISRRRATSAQRGDAFHKYMLFADHERACGDPERELFRLIEAQFLSPEEGGLLRMEEIRAFYRSRLFERMRRAERVEREFRFMARLGEEELDGKLGDIGGERVTVQGICDLLLFEKGGAVLVDYKTDRVQLPDELRARHAPQVLLYARILRQLLDIPVRECLLYSTALSAEISVEVVQGTGLR